MKNIFYLKTTVIIVLLVFSGCAKPEAKGENYSLEDLKSDFLIEYPIDSLREAFEVLKNDPSKNLIQNLEETESGPDFDFDWTISGQKQENNWLIIIETNGVLPSFSCEYLIDENGESLSVVKECGWNK